MRSYLLLLRQRDGSRGQGGATRLVENDLMKFLWVFQTQTNKQVMVNQPDTAVVD